MNFLKQIEAILFAKGGDGISLSELSKILQISNKALLENISEYERELSSENRGLSLQLFNGNIKLVTKKECSIYLEKLKNEQLKTSLSIAAIEVLSIIAAKEPVTKQEVEKIRGVGCDGLFLKLRALELIEEKERSNLPGMPILYVITSKFYDLFKLENKEAIISLLSELELSQQQNIFN
ncbi:MAG: SMC-Scp complex subunit ScpB [Mycoplasma sp.]